MDFFKSVFAADPDPPNSQPEDVSDDEIDHHHHRHRQQQQQQRRNQVSDPDPDEGAPASASTSTNKWGFGDLVKTLASRSESVIQIYRRDLEEFGTGLRKETAAFRQVADRVVRDLPTSLEIGASAAQESLENVGQVIDDLGGTVWRGTTGILSQVIDSDAEGGVTVADPQTSGTKRYSRFEVQLMGMQGDQATFLDDPEDIDDFRKWKEGFQLSDDEVDELCAGNAVLEGLFDKLVPRAVNYDTFWIRYFYKASKLRQAEDARAKLVKRVIAREADDDEDLSWEVDDDEYEEEKGYEPQKKTTTELPIDGVQGTGKKDEIDNVDNSINEIVVETTPTTTTTTTTTTKEEVDVEVEKPIDNDKPSPIEKTVVDEKPAIETKQVETIEKEAVPLQSELKAVEEEKPVIQSKQVETTEKAFLLQSSELKAVEEEKPVIQSKQVETTEKAVPLQSELKVKDDRKPSVSSTPQDSDVSIVSSQPSLQEEDDLGWDEIEDLGENDVKKKPETSSVAVNKVDLRKRLTVAEDDEDLSWDIEDD